MTDKIISMNTQGFQNKRDRINEIAQAHQPLALVVNEHFQSDPKKLDQIDGYKLANSYCRAANEKGGVGIFVKEGVDYKVRSDLDSYSRKKEFEHASVEFTDHDLVLTAGYRTPSSSKTKFNASLDAMLTHCSEEPDKYHVMAGDFNIDNSKRNSTQQVLKNNGQKFLLNKSTHDYGACLDNFIADFEPAKTRVMRAKIDTVSDHRPIEMVLPSKKTKDPWTSYRTPARQEFYDDYSDCGSEYSSYSYSSPSSGDHVSQLSSGMAKMSLSPGGRAGRGSGGGKTGGRASGSAGKATGSGSRSGRGKGGK